MSDRPTIHLTNLASRSLHHGRVWSIMAFTPPWAQPFGVLHGLAPPTADFLAWQKGIVFEAEYKRRYLIHVEEMAGHGLLSPGILAHEDGTLVEDGDTLCCTCPAPKSPRRKHECHREWLAPLLVRAGWRVVLDGVEVVP